MIRVPLSLARVPPPAHTPAAWFIAGGDAAIWLEELSRWNVPLSKARLFVLPSSPSNPAVTGVLVKLDNTRPRETLRAEAYGCVAGRVYLPVCARFEPPVTDVELAQLAAFEISVFHPGAGLVGFRAADGISVASLLELPPRRAASWDRARPGASPYPRLISVEPDVVISLDELMQAGRGDIGSKPPDALPPHDKEVNPIVGKAMIAGLGAAGSVAGALGGIASGIGGLLGGGAGAGTTGAANGDKSSGGRGKFDAFKEWASSYASRLNERLESARNKELDRLLRMLDDDPDKGLSYAIPLAGKEGQPRGTAQAGANLIPRGTNFDLGSLRGGGPVDPWGMPEKVRAQLREKYVKAANRELQLGRFRRAAYIFSELLGDHNAAANALKQGRFFREAAVVYRDVLKNKLLAAECLEEGGLITEAIALREELKHWLIVARLYEKIERPEDARVAYRKAASEAKDRMDLIAAAQILNDSLGEHDEALGVLGEGWPDSPQAQACLTKKFELLGTLGRHRAAAKVAQGLRAAKLSYYQAQTAADVCARQCSVYPDAEFRVQTADVVRVIAGQHLGKLASDRVRALTNAVASLAPEDRLLARDASRYVEQRIRQDRQSQKVVPIPVRAPLKVSNKPVTRRLVRTLRLGHAGASWSAAAAAGDNFFVAGSLRTENDRPGLLVVRGLWTGELQSESWVNAPAMQGRTIILEAPRLAWQMCVVGPVKGHRLESRLFPGSRVGPGLRLGTPAMLKGGTVAFRYDENGNHYALSFEDNGDVELAEGKLEIFDPQGNLMHQAMLTMLPADHVPMDVGNGRVFVSNGASGLIAFYDGKFEVLDLGRPIHNVVASAPFTRLRVAVALEEGGVVLWPDTPAKKQVRFGQGMIAPVIGFTRGGDLVAVTKTEVRVYHTESETLVISCSVAGPGEEPYAVLPAEGVDEYAVFLKNGDVQVWHV